MKKVLLLALVLLLMPASSAQGAVDRGELSMYLSIAEKHWGQRVDCLHVEEADLPGALARAEVGLPDWSHVGDTGAAPIKPACNMWVNPTLWPSHSRPRRCDTIVHEFGHLLGLVHTHDRSVMDPLRDRIIKVCRQPAKGQAAAMTRVARSG